MLLPMSARVCLSLLGAISLGLLSGPRGQATPWHISPDSVNGPITSHHLVVLFEPPTDEKVDNSRGGASRPTEVKCREDAPYVSPLTALVPRSGVGLTMASRPTLLVYVPPTMATQAHLTLKDVDQNGLYQGHIDIPQTGGILSIALPTDSPELTIGETYHWSVALLCQPTQTDMPITSGQIRRVEPVATFTDQQSLLLQTITYGKSGVWHDMLASLAVLRQTQPDNNDLNDNWVELLRNEELGAIATMPLLN